MSFVINLVGIAAFVTNVIGNLLLARKSVRGWLIRIVSILLWGSYGIAAASLPNTINAIAFLGINIYGWWSWAKKAKLHDYTSTTCQHGKHVRCRQTCKFCSIRCSCGCHKKRGK